MFRVWSPLMENYYFFFYINTDKILKFNIYCALVFKSV